MLEWRESCINLKDHVFKINHEYDGIKGTYRGEIKDGKNHGYGVL